MKSRKNEPALTMPTAVDSSFLKTLVGYNTRRATLHIMQVFAKQMGPLDLTEVEFSMLSLIGRNPGLTPSQLCAALDLLPPNLTKLLARIDKRGLVERQVPAADKRAVCLRLTATGQALLDEAEAKAEALEVEASSALTARQRETLISLLQKIYG